MDEENYGVSPDGATCEKCGAALFKVVPGETTKREIIDFARESEGWKGNPEALEGWMPSGLFCPNGHVAIHTQHSPPWEPRDEGQLYAVFIKSPGPNKLKVMSYLRKLKDLTTLQAKEILDHPKICVAVGQKDDLDIIMSDLQELGAVVTRRKYKGESVYAYPVEEWQGQSSLAADIFWNGLILVVLAGLITGAVHYFHPDIKWLKVAANILVLIVGTVVLSVFGAWLEVRGTSDEIVIEPPFAALLFSIVIGGTLTLFFGWYSTIAILGVFTVLVLTFGLKSSSSL